MGSKDKVDSNNKRLSSTEKKNDMGIFNIFFSDCLGERDDNHRSLQIEPAG